MKLIIDIETDHVKNSSTIWLDVKHIWLAVTKDIDSGEVKAFKNLTSDASERERFLSHVQEAHLIGHNILGFDYPVLNRLLGLSYEDIAESVTDTLILSKLIDYPREKHSIEDYGKEFGIEKGKFTDFNGYSPEMEEYCRRDVEICHKVYLKYLKYILKEEHKESIRLEHKFQMVTNDLSTNGFYFSILKAKELLKEVTKYLSTIDISILSTFRPKLKYIRMYTPKVTTYGTISKSSVPRALGHDLSIFTEGAPFSYCKWVEFNPSSHKQLCDVLNQAGWRPLEKTETHKEKERELSKLKRSRNRDEAVDLRIKQLYDDLQKLKIYGWKINEANLETLPKSAPSSARLLAQRILYESRRRTLTEWLALVRPDTGRVHGKFYGIGAWTHRMAHQNPNTANIPNEFDQQGRKKLLGKELRSLWSVPKNRLLVGVDAEGIQLRIFAHYIDDKEFTDALVNGRKSDKTDPHSFNQRVLGDRCRHRQAAKRFVYALLLGAGISKLAQILECSEADAQEALDRLMERYTGFTFLKEKVFPNDARRGWFIGLDGRKVRIPGDTQSARRHLAMSGYLQNGEALVMKRATLKWHDKLKDYDSKLVNFVHDEWQVETPNNMEVAIKVASMLANSLVEVGEELKLKCPLAGSYWSDDHNDYTIAKNWAYTH